ncbi:MAG TPA: hypothetical protein VFS21_11270 [Roseiflexaceae bacterium]|nr:hypothetical protein [Roseiflexaceae bacterium]
MSDHTFKTHEWDELVYRYGDQLFRLALLVDSDQAGAEALALRAYEQVDDAGQAAEASLLRALLARRRSQKPWRLAAGVSEAERAGLSPEHTRTLVDMLARATPAERLVLGMHTLQGRTAQEIAALLPGQPTHPEEVLARFRRDTVRALGLLPPDADEALLASIDRWLDGRAGEDEVLELRRAVLGDERARAARDALNAARRALDQGVPALCAAGAPPRLVERLLALGEQPAERPARPPLRAAALGLTLGVLALAAAIIFGPSLLGGSLGGQAQEVLTAEQIVEASVRRFEQAPLQQGILHEQLRISIPGRSAYTIERWYDYAAPQRIAMTVREERRRGQQFTVTSNGQDLIQYRFGGRGSDNGLDLRLSPAQLQQALPILRSLPGFSLIGWSEQPDIAPLLLGQARESGVSSLGQTSYQGRTAYLLTYRTDRLALPNQNDQAPRAQRVLLTIDAQTYSLLNIAALADGESESSATHLLRAEQLEVLAEVPEGRFLQTGAAQERSGPTSFQLPTLPAEALLSLEEARQQSDLPLLVPQALPDDSMRAVVVRTDNSERGASIGLLYEGEHSTLMLLPDRSFFVSDQNQGEPRTAGSFRYWLLAEQPQQPGLLAAIIERPEADEQRLVMLFSSATSTTAERDKLLEQTIASLTPLTPQNVDALKQPFAEPEQSGS